MPQQCTFTRSAVALAAFASSWVGEGLLAAFFTGNAGLPGTLVPAEPRELVLRAVSALVVGGLSWYLCRERQARRRAEEGRRRSEGLWSLVAEGSKVAACVVETPAWTIRGASPLFLQMYPATAASPLGAALAEVLRDPSIRDAALALLQKNAAGGSPEAREIASSDGSLYREICCYPLGPSESTPDGFLLVIRDLSSQRRCETLAQTVQEGHRALLESLGSPVALAHADGTLQVVNSAFLELTGLARAEAEGKISLASIVSPQSRDKLTAWGDPLPEAGGAQRLELCILDRHGVEKTVMAERSHLPGTRDAVVSLCDISVGKQVEEELRASRATLDLVQRISRMGNWEWDVVTDTLSWSGEMYRLFSVEQEHFVPHHEAVLHAVHPDDKERVIKAINNALYNKKAFDLDYRILAGGGVRTISARAEVSFDADGKPLRMVGTNQDISWRIEAEAALRNSEEKFSKAFHASPDSIVITRADDGSYIDVNEAFQEMTGYSREEVMGRSSYADLKLWADPDARMMMLKLMNQHGHVRNLEVQFRVKSGEIRELLWSADVIEYGGEACLIAISRDVTEQRHLEQELLKSEAKLYMKHEELKNLFQQMEGIRREWEETMDCVSDLFILSDQWGKIRRFNRAVEEFSGKAHRDIVGRDWLGFLEEQGMKHHVSAPGVELFHEPTGKWFVLKRYAFPAAEVEGTTREVVIINDTTGIGHREAAASS